MLNSTAALTLFVDISRSPLDKSELSNHVLHLLREYIDYGHKVRGYAVMGIEPSDIDLDNLEDMLDAIDEHLTEWEEM